VILPPITSHHGHDC